MALHPENCFCEACKEPVFCDWSYPDFERKFTSNLKLPTGDFSSEVDASSFGGVVIESLTQFPTSVDPEILSMDLPTQKSVEDFFHKKLPSQQQRSYFTQVNSANESWDGIAETTSANSQEQLEDEALSDPKKIIMYGLLAYLLLRK